MRSIQTLPKDTVYDEMNSPVGTLTLIASKEGLHAILWDTDPKVKGLSQSKNEKTITETKKQLNEYFQGSRKTFNLPLVLNGTDFQIQAWKQLQKIPYGTTISYGQQAERIGNKNKARAAGMANGQNPISIVIPCHRVIGSNGTLTGFGGGIASKEWLLKHEQKTRK